MTIRVLIADDHTLFRQGLINLMETRDDLVEVVGEAATGEEAVKVVAALRPDVVLMDIYMPAGDGLEATREILEHFPQTCVVMLTSSENSEHMNRALSYGASGYLLKNLDAVELFELIAGVVCGEAAMTREMVSGMSKRGTTQPTMMERGEEPLSERELSVLRLIATGASNQEIAGLLFISINTVKSHMRTILDKLQLENRTQAASYAMNHGLAFPREQQTETLAQPVSVNHLFG